MLTNPEKYSKYFSQFFFLEVKQANDTAVGLYVLLHKAVLLHFSTDTFTTANNTTLLLLMIHVLSESKSTMYFYCICNTSVVLLYEVDNTAVI